VVPGEGDAADLADGQTQLRSFLHITLIAAAHELTLERVGGRVDTRTHQRGVSLARLIAGIEPRFEQYDIECMTRQLKSDRRTNHAGADDSDVRRFAHARIRVTLAAHFSA
jgi:hypothetical protein